MFMVFVWVTRWITLPPMPTYAHICYEPQTATGVRAISTFLGAGKTTLHHIHKREPQVLATHKRRVSCARLCRLTWTYPDTPASAGLRIQLIQVERDMYGKFVKVRWA